LLHPRDSQEAMERLPPYLPHSNSHCGQGPREIGGFCASDLQTGLISWFESGLGVVLGWSWGGLGVALGWPWGRIGVAL
jgi:hypothetical protein